MAAAKVAVEPVSQAAVQRGSTGLDGRYCTPVAPGSYIVKISSTNLDSAVGILIVPEKSEEIERNFVLQVSSLANHMQVIGSRLPENLLESPIPSRQLDRQQIGFLGARQLTDVLQEQPEVVTFAGGSHAKGGSTNLQGFTSRNVEILVDGQPLAGRVSGYLDLGQIDSSIVEAVEVKTGASAMTYGLQGLGGAINLITRRASTGAQGALETGYGQLNNGLLRAEGGFATDGWAGLAVTSLQRSLGYDLDPTTAVATQSPSRTRNLFTSLYTPQWKGIGGGFTGLWTDQTYWGFDQSTSAGTYDFSRPKRRLVLVPRASLALNGENLLTVRARHMYYRSEEDLVYRSPFSASATATTQRGDGVEGEWTLVKPGGLRALVGGSFHRQDIRGSSLGTTDGNAQRDSTSQLTSVEYSFWRRLKVQGGYRLDHDSLFGTTASPQAVVAWRARDGVSFSLTAARGFRAPDFSELYLNNSHAGGRVRVLGNTALNPERSWSNTAGALWTPRGKVRLEAQVFNHRMENLIQSTYVGREGTASVYRYMNLAAGRIRGTLLSAEASPRRGISMGVSYQYLVARDLTALTPLEYSPRHRTSARAGYTYRPWGLLVGVFANTTGQTFYGLENGAETYMRSFKQVGVNAQKELTRHLTLRATWRNLSNDVDPDYRFTTPRAIEGSLRWHWGGDR